MGLDKHRTEIDRIDSELLRLLNERAGHALEIAKVKRETDAPFYVPERERAVMQRLADTNEGPLGTPAVQAIFREVMSAARALEKPTSVAFLGPRDTFSHMAGLRVFGASADYHPLPSFNDIFTEVERGRVDYGIVPVESAIGGSVGATLDRFLQSDLKIINEVMIRVALDLMSRSPLEEIAKVYSKDNALLQCRSWLHANLPSAQLVETSSTAEAARRAAEEPGVAAIASRLAADTYGLDVLVEHIEDVAYNYTRFLVLGRQGVAATGDDKTSVLIGLAHQSGALYGLLMPFAEAGLSLTRIESRPSQNRPWEYVFFIDFLGHSGDPKIAAVLEKVGRMAVRVKVLGSFPRAELPEVGT